MKTLSAIASLLLLVTMQNCNADLVHDLIGRWTGSEKTTRAGVTEKSSVTTVYERFQEDGLIITSTLKSPERPVRKRVLRCYDSGKVEGVFTSGGQTYGLVVGTWRITNSKLAIKVKVSALAGSYKQTTKMILFGPRKTSAIIKQSNGLRGVATMVKK